jgi:hypothetical protein
MGSWRKAYGRLGALALVVVVLAACSGSNATWPAVSPSNVPLPSGVHVVVPSDSGPVASQAVASGAPRATAAAVTVDQITASYSYGGSLVTPLAHLYGTIINDYVIVSVVNNNTAAVKVVVTSQITDYTNQASDTVMVDAGATQEVRQDPHLTSTAIDGLNSAHQADLHVVVSYLEAGQPRTVFDQTSTVTVTSRRDMPLQIEGFSMQEIRELESVFATPSDPSVEELIRKAANYMPNHAMGDVTDAATGRAQMAAIWQAEANDYHLYYVSTTETFAAASQRIRLPGEVLPEASGNCIELSMLYTAVAEALSLKPYLIYVPGHTYFGVDLSGHGDDLVIETTMIRGSSFDAAVAKGAKELDTDLPHIQAGDDLYNLVDVEAARAKGILPIPWH